MTNLLDSLNTTAVGGFFSSSQSTAARVASRMDGLALFLKTCKGTDCRFAWRHLFPNGEVTSIKQALNKEYDQYFDRLPKIQFTSCDLGYFSELLVTKLAQCKLTPLHRRARIAVLEHQLGILP